MHDKWYDLTEWIGKHPGGSDWLLLTAGQDVTEAFEVHHLRSAKAEAVLKKFYVCDADTSYRGRYVWDTHGFFMTVKRSAIRRCPAHKYCVWTQIRALNTAMSGPRVVPVPVRLDVHACPIHARVCDTAHAAYHTQRAHI